MDCKPCALNHILPAHFSLKNSGVCGCDSEESKSEFVSRDVVSDGTKNGCQMMVFARVWKNSLRRREKNCTFAPQKQLVP